MNILKKIFPFLILLISVSSILQWCSLPIGNTAVWWLIQSFIIYCFWLFKPVKYSVWQINIFLILILYQGVYGAMFMAEDYWHWKMLINNLMVFSLPLASYTFAKPVMLQRTLRLWFKYGWILFLLLLPFLGSDAIGRFLVPYSFLLLFITLLDKKYLLYSLGVYCLVLLFGYDSRSDLIKYTICLVFGCLYYIPIIRSNLKFLFKSAAVIMYPLPIVLFILGALGTFNIFNLDEELGLDKKYEMTSSTGNTQSAFTDTRTPLFYEQVSSAIENNYVIMGRSLARGCDSQLFGAKVDDSKRSIDPNYVGRGERDASEVSIHNIFNYFGLVGVFVYLLIFMGASYKAICRSNNIYMPIVGVLIAFRWVYAWVEDFSRFDLNYLFIWILIGMCYSPLYRNMSNNEFKQWIKAVIGSKY